MGIPTRMKSRRAHARARVLLSDYLDGALSRRRTSRLERHIRSCNECRSTVTSVPNALRMLRSLEVDAPADLADGVIAHLDELRSPDDAAHDEARGRELAPPRAASGAGSGLLGRTRDVLTYCLTPAYLRRSIPIATVIGIGLTAIYQLDDFLAGRADAGADVMCACNFIVPFVLVSIGLAMARAAPRRRRR